MCGICGKISFEGSGTVSEAEIRSMMDAMIHRGPDQEGLYLDRTVGLGHRRLSIIDLSSGRQPISNEDESIWIVFNGEIYNFQSLRADLESKGHSFKTNSDTEVIVHCYEEYGDSFLGRLRGMFTFAIWDTRNQRLLVARDRVGIKPLYYTTVSGSLLFASEIKALLTNRQVEKKIDADALYLFMAFYYTPGERTLLKNIHRLPPGHFMLVEKGRCEIKRYWDIRNSFRTKRNGTAAREKALDEMLSEAVRLHMISDVPVGFLLSGGVDSTGLLSYAVTGSDWRIKTYTIGFEGEKFADERRYAALAAGKYQLEHHVMTISDSEFFGYFPRFIWHMEEPVCEPPAIALYFISRLAKEHVTVLVSGEGGDEAFAGYQNYRNLALLEKGKRLLGSPGGWRSRLARNILTRAYPSKLRKYSDFIDIPIERYYYSRTSSPFNFFNKNASSIYDRHFCGGVSENCVQSILEDLMSRCNGLSPLEKMLYVDFHTWLPDDLLIKADKMTMAHSMELRVPLLDHEVLEFAASLPEGAKLDGWDTKHILKKVLAPKVPKEIINRKKTGFPVPYARWLKKEYREGVLDLLLDRRTLERGYFDKKFIRGFLEKEFNSTESNPKEIFSLMCLEMWHRIFIDESGMSSFK